MSTPNQPTEPPVGTRERIVRATAGLLAEGGREAVSTRAIGAAAGVQAPTIYRLFGDLRGLLDEVMSYGFASYLEAKTSRAPAADPVEDLRRGWDLHVGFGVANPALYALIYGDPKPGGTSTAATRAAEILDGLVHRVAIAGRLRVDAQRAARIIHSAGCGVTLTLIATAPEDRDPLVSEITREAVLAAVTIDDPPGGPAGGAAFTPGETGRRAESVVTAAAALQAALQDEPAPLTAAERGLLVDWLGRLTRAEHPQE